jgi:hypothetical protein
VNYWLLTLSLINVLLIAFIAFTHLTRNKSKAEDQRLTKGLQLLQNKISILQDLSDKTDEQVRKWIHLIENKSGEVQRQLNVADEKVTQIEEALSKALDVSKIFYEQVPHAEMAERQKTSKYVQAAKLANQGFSADQISQKIDLSLAEIEMIIKMNREELQFAEDKLPAWVQTSAEANDNTGEQRDQELTDFTAQLKKMNQSMSAQMSATVSSTAFDLNKPDMSSMNEIRQRFTDSIAQNSTHIPQTFIDEKKEAGITRTESGKIVRPFEFRKIVK